mgnify:FL=1
MTSQARQYPKTRTARRIAGLLAAVFALSACEVGEGTRPVSMTLLDPTTGLGEITLNQCFEGSLAALVVFSNGQVANFLQQGGFPRPVELSSSDESVVRVSDGTLPVPLLENQAYVRGALLPVGPGTATITAKYSSLEEQIQVTVQPPGGVEVRPGTQTVARGATQLFDVFAILNGTERDVTPLVIWSLEDENGNPMDPTKARISATGVLEGRELGGPYVVKAGLTACATPDLLPATVDAEDLRAQVSVKEAQGLVLERLDQTFDEEGAPLPAPPLIVATSQVFKTFATFADPADGRHDVTPQSRCEVIEPGLPEGEVSGRAIFVTALGAGLLQSLAVTEPDNPLLVQAEFGDEEAGEALTSNALEVEIVQGVLEAIRISPENATVGLGQSVDYSVEGDYRLADESLLTLDVTRQIRLSSSDGTVARPDETAANPGRVTAVALEPGCTRIRAQALGPQGDTSALVTDQTQLFVINDTVACEPEAAP